MLTLLNYLLYRQRILKRKPNLTSKWEEIIPRFASDLEKLLFEQSKSLEEYSDNDNLYQRLFKIASRLKLKRKVPYKT